MADVPNFDAMSADDLWAFWQLTLLATRADAAAVVGKFPGYTKVYRNLGHYAANKATAMRARVRGDIISAQMYESICDRIYERLPTHVRW